MATVKTDPANLSSTILLDFCTQVSNLINPTLILSHQPLFSSESRSLNINLHTTYFQPKHSPQIKCYAQNSSLQNPSNSSSPPIHPLQTLTNDREAHKSLLLDMRRASISIFRRRRFVHFGPLLPLPAHLLLQINRQMHHVWLAFPFLSGVVFCHLGRSGFDGGYSNTS